MFGFGFKKKWKSSKESKEQEQPPTNGIQILKYREINNEFAPITPVPQNVVPRKTRVRRNVMETFRQSYPNYSLQNLERKTREQPHFETVQHPTVPVPNDKSETPFSSENAEKSTLIFMTENHDDIVLRRPKETEPVNEDVGENVDDAFGENFAVNLGATFDQRLLQLRETLPSEEQELELEDIYGARNVNLQGQNIVHQASNSDKDSIGDQETVDLENATSELEEDNFRVHVMHHPNDAMSVVSYQSGDTLLDTASVLHDENPKLRFDDFYNFGDSQTDEMQQKEDEEDNYKSEIEDDVNHPINVTVKQDEQLLEAEETMEINDVSDVKDIVSERVEKRVMFDVSNKEEKSYKRKIKPEIISTPQRKETLEDVKMKPGYSVQASALFFKGTVDNDGNESETSA